MAGKLAKYELLCKIGEGTYGVVFKAREYETNTYFALKKVRLDNDSEGIPQSAVREISLLMELSHHPNIVT